ncbi:glutaredoxin family protein [Phormidesmis sp. 146-33]
MKLILYSKPGCHLCEGLQEKLEQIQTLEIDLEIRDITTRDDWFQAYQYEIPVLFLVDDQANPSSLIPHPSSLIPHPSSLLPRLSPRATVHQLEQMLQKYGGLDR